MSLLDEYSDLMQPTPLHLPPKREIMHEINLVDKDCKYHYRLPRCPESLRPALADKIEHYTQAGWWVEGTSSQAAPMMCIRKPDGRLRTVVDCRARNSNTVKDVTPFPDQDSIHTDIACAKYHTKLDLADTYEQILIREDHVAHTAFSTPYGVFFNKVLQQGDCNCPVTFQHLMTCLFRKFIPMFMHIYLDDIYIFSNTLREHYRHIISDKSLTF
jgi:hypothetical protein